MSSFNYHFCKIYLPNKKSIANKQVDMMKNTNKCKMYLYMIKKVSKIRKAHLLVVV